MCKVKELLDYFFLNLDKQGIHGKVILIAKVLAQFLSNSTSILIYEIPS